MPPRRVYDASDTYVHLDRDGGAEALHVDTSFWQRINDDARLQNGRLVGLAEGSSGASSWEMHPVGEELLWLLEGEVDIVLEIGRRKETVELRGNGFCIVPRGVWHQQVYRKPARILFVTAGTGTQHRHK